MSSTCPITSRLNARKRALERHAHRTVERLQQPEFGLEAAAATLDWDGTMGFHAYATRLAELNDTTLTRMLGRSYGAAAWRSGHPELLDRLATVAGLDAAALRAWSSRRYPALYRGDRLLGYIDPGGRDSRMVLHLLPRGDVRSKQVEQTVLWSSERRALLQRLATIAMPRLTAKWPPGPTGDDALRAVVLDDASRHEDITTWSPPVRAYALLTLWEHAHLGDLYEPQGRCASARDFIAVERWTDAARELSQTWPELAAHLGDAALDWPPPERPTAPASWDGPDEIACGTGPFTIRDLARWPLAVLQTIHAATIALHALAANQHDTDRAWRLEALHGSAIALLPPATRDPFLVPTPSPSWQPPGMQRRWQPPPFVGDAARLVTTEHGHSTLCAVAKQARERPAPLQVATAATWWPAIRTVTARANAMDRPGAAPTRTLLGRLLWVDLTGHLAHAPADTAEHWALVDAAAQLAADDVLQLRELALAAIDGIDDLEQLSWTHRSPKTQRRRA